MGRPSTASPQPSPAGTPKTYADDKNWERRDSGNESSPPMPEGGIDDGAGGPEPQETLKPPVPIEQSEEARLRNENSELKDQLQQLKDELARLKSQIDESADDSQAKPPTPPAGDPSGSADDSSKSKDDTNSATPADDDGQNKKSGNTSADTQKINQSGPSLPGSSDDKSNVTRRTRSSKRTVQPVRSRRVVIPNTGWILVGPDSSTVRR